MLRFRNNYAWYVLAEDDEETVLAGPFKTREEALVKHEELRAEPKNATKLPRPPKVRTTAAPVGSISKTPKEMEK